MGCTSSSHALEETPKQAKELGNFDCDAMISYEVSDIGVARSLKKTLTEQGVRVWMDETGSPTTNGKAIVAAKAFILLLSDHSAKSAFCKDDLALAFITNCTILPVYLQEPTKVAAHLDFGMKLTLGPLPTYEMWDASAQGPAIKKLSEEVLGTMKGSARQHGAMDETGSATINFWDSHFEGIATATWAEFKAALEKDYGDDFGALFPGERKSWLLNMLHVSIFSSGEQCQKHHYDKFVKLRDPTGTVPFWHLVQLLATERSAVDEVFDVTSSVRVAAVENLSSFQTPEVVQALGDLLGDDDANVRAVAAISLGRISRGSDEQLHAVLKTVETKLIQRLRDPDRLVREATCLACAALKSNDAIPGIVHLWRNDAISTVRAAALLSLKKIGGDEADKAMHVTRVLTEEIEDLSKDD